MSRAYISLNLRREVIERAGACCEYCLISQQDKIIPFEIDHIISEKHHGQTTADNLCLSCFRCNMYKGSDIAGADPQTGLPTFLFHPRKDDWHIHFSLKDVIIQPLTPQARITVLLLQLNSQERIAERLLMKKLGTYPCK